MATYQQARASGNQADDAAFRALWGWVSGRLTAGGWTKTGDTGQIDLTTVARPTAINTSAGYEIRESPTIGGFQKIYVKLEYGTGSAVQYPALWITVGTGTDGAGTLTGYVTTRDQMFFNLGTAVEDLVSIGTDYFAVLVGGSTVSGNINALWAVLERWTDADGNYATDGWVVMTMGTSLGFTQSISSAAALISNAAATLGYYPPSYAATGNVVFVAPCMPNRYGPQYPMRAVAMFALYFSSPGATHTFAMFPGKTQVWRSCFHSIPVGGTNIADLATNLSPIFRWE